MNTMKSDRPMKRNSLRWPQKYALYSWVNLNRERISVMSVSRMAEAASSELNHKFTISNCRWILKNIKKEVPDAP